MKINEKNIVFHANDTHKGGNLIDSKNGAKNGFCMGLSYYFSDDFGVPGIHEDQEGFYVIEGSGKAAIGSEVFDVQVGDSFLVPAGVEHVLKKDRHVKHLKVLWSHGAI